MSPVHRVEVRQKSGQSDPRGQAILRQAEAVGLPVPTAAEHASVYLIEGAIDGGTVARIAAELLADPVTQDAVVVGSGGAPRAARADAMVEVHPLPGVTDPAAESVELAVKALFGTDVRVRTGDRYDLTGVDAATARQLGERALANPVIQGIHPKPFHPDQFPSGHQYTLQVRSHAICTLGDAELESLSRSAHLFLSLEEMRAIQAEYRRLGREPREIELETLAQTWSEHCVHKTLKSTARYTEANLAPGQRSMLDGAAGKPGHSVEGRTLTLKNVLKSTIAAATFNLTDIARPGHIDWCLSVFVDNSGVIAFDDVHAVCFKVETHNRPSAIEPYGGAATGIGGCIRDVMGTGLGAKPIASTDVFCVAPLGMKDIPPGCLSPRRILTQVVAGVRDYGNRMGIPTVNGAVWFDPRYVGNPLVYCGVVGTMPRTMVKGSVQPGDRIVAMGGRTGRDGIHGATFSSAEVEHGHANEFSHAVQIGNAITEKKMLDALLAARDQPGGPIYRGLTDCGAGGFSSAVGEMGRELGATVHLERAPVKYDGLSPTEVWISEAQERMVLAVPAANVARLRSICADYGVEMCDLGEFGTPDGTIRLHWHGTEVGALDTHFLHEGVPMPVREAVW
ncbi:MAG: phosphoribosylformylglycinamidine synthase subunit PurS, partial [Phycisphaerae bacterium]|nr:phosphoribosylformylglycinamidine synthase subunit PurS [Phycisphaerae bacterium]